MAKVPHLSRNTVAKHMRLLEEHGVQVYGESEAGTLAERGEAREEGQSASRPLPSKYPGKND